MKLRRDYRRVDAGAIPETWITSTLGDLADPSRPISYGIVQTGSAVGNGVRCLRVVDIDDGRINDRELITTSKAISDAYRRTILKIGDLVMPLRGKVGDVAVIDRHLAGCNLTRGLALIAIRPGNVPAFFKQIISFSGTRALLERTMNGSALQEIPIATLRGFSVSHPQKEAEQKAIAQALGDADALIESLEQLFAKKRRLKHGAMQELLTGKKRLPGFAEKWEVRPLGKAIGALDTGVSVNSIEGAASVGSGNPAILKTSCLNRGVFFPNECKQIAERDVGRARLSPRADTILISRMNTVDLVGECGYIDADYPTLFVPDRLWMARCFRDSGVSARWLAYSLSSENYRRLLKEIATGTSGSMKNISQSAFLSLTLRFPPFEEQSAIAAVLSDMDAQFAAIEAKLAKARLVKQGMMQELLTGRIRLV